MWRVFGIPTPLSGALHTVASQHMTTLHNASGMHILCCEPAQVKYPLFATHFCASNVRVVFSDRVRAAASSQFAHDGPVTQNSSFDTEQCAMDFCCVARDDRSDVNTITTNAPTR